MVKNNSSIYCLAVGLALLVASACSSATVQPPTATRTPLPAATLAPSATYTPIPPPATLQPTITKLPDNVGLRTCQSSSQIIPGHFLLQRPIDPAYVDSVDTTYTYGTTNGGLLDVHHGVEFVNEYGTPVLAAAPGVVLVAGTDSQERYGPYLGFYGNLVILQHTFPGFSEPVFTLYAHLSTVLVQPGQQVETGEQVGEVGFSGIATGSHLHFEVRYAANSYNTTRNPENWMVPRSGDDGQARGLLVGYIMNTEGNIRYASNVSVEHLPPAGQIAFLSLFHETYASATVNRDDHWSENFAFGDLPAGRYRVSFVYGALYEQQVDILPGQVTLATFCVN
ncbi:MAG: M23 family metallopeptidase [Anaerolineae bacterium]|nr:M23 family metallopeptidase [Anaerolineae bacterium]